MSARRLFYLAAAQAEVREAFEWYFERSLEAAARFLTELDRATLLIRETPTVWPSFGRGTRKYVLQGFPYSVIYREVGDELQVVAVAHGKRKPGYWRSRTAGQR
ncbi:MAG TPA: type II toxin-antitoxin system RelE/ParE family toxin [Thermoanaerobaculia bacterium]|nr:type II toxin-antitoxin system RelE/ParE family toxin [Thermoanaerobaculia bacterium]